MHRVLTVTGSKPVPALKLQGIWLKSLGYAVGSKVSIVARAGVIRFFSLLAGAVGLPIYKDDV